MGPPTTSTESRRGGSSGARERLLQWGRRQTSTERPLVLGDRRDAPDDASMGPPTNVDGEVSVGASHHFGGSMLQWGRRQTSTERTDPEPETAIDMELQWRSCWSFNGAADKRRRRESLVGYHGIAHGRFNGAADKRKCLASMGPPTNVDGEFRVFGSP